MAALGMDWKGDLVRTLNANRLPPPLGDVRTPDAVIVDVARIIGERLELSGGFEF